MYYVQKCLFGLMTLLAVCFVFASIYSLGSTIGV
jgi:hypothetical protein